MVRTILAFAITLVLLVLPQGAKAQKGQQIFDLFLQGAQQELYRQEQRDNERQRRQEMQTQHRQFVALWQACFRDDLGACDQALGYPYLNFNDRQRLVGKRSEIIAARHEAGERVRRDRIEAEYVERRRQRERELQAQQDRERELARQREVADQERQRTEQAERDRRVAPPQIAAVTQTQSLRDEQPQDASAIMGSWTLLVVVIAVGAALTIFLCRDALLARTHRSWNLLVQLCSSLVVSVSGRKEPRRAASGKSAPPEDVAGLAGDRAPPAFPVAEERTRDTVGAIAAMELAHAFIEEIRAADMPGLEDKDARRHHLNTLSLASRHLDAAEKLDPDAVLEGQSDKDVSFRFTVNELKSEALLLEGLTHQVYDLKRAIPALVAATKADPNNARAFYVLGLTHAANRNKSAAVAAFRSAVALDPKNIAFRKELSRAESLSAAEIAGYKATRAGERIYDAGIATANAGIMAWNVFAVIWNVVTFPLRMVFAIFRLLRLHPFA